MHPSGGEGWSGGQCMCGGGGPRRNLCLCLNFAVKLKLLLKKQAKAFKKNPKTHDKGDSHVLSWPLFNQYGPLQIEYEMSP